MGDVNGADEGFHVGDGGQLSRISFSEMPWASAFARITRSIRSPSMPPGWIQLTRMRSGRVPWRRSA